MINLLPPGLKEDLRYAKQNSWLIGYVKLLAVVAVVLAGAFVGTHIYLQKQLDAVNQQVAEKQATVAGYSKVEKQAKAANDRLEAVQQVSNQRTHFAELLDALSSVLPKGIVLKQLSLTGNDALPVAIDYQAPSYQVAVSMRDALLLSSKIKATDITAIQQDPQGSTYSGHVIVGFATGAFK